MNSKPLIGLTPNFYEIREMDRSNLGISYTDSIQKAGGLPVLIPPIIDKGDLDQLLQRLDGIVLTGGDDLNPECYGETQTMLTPDLCHPRREIHDKRVFEYIWEHKVPTLAICLGMQEVNVFLGGSLYQDITTSLENHQIHKIGDWFDARHVVSLLEDSAIFQITGLKELETNSAHHQAVRDVAGELKVTGTSKDGIIEVLEPRDPSIPLMAVQWHPESETDDTAGIELFKWLISKTSDSSSSQLPKI